MTAILLIAIVLFAVFPFVRCAVFNIVHAIYYSVKDIIDYIKNKRWKDFNYFGIDMYVAMFGHGKTLSMTHKARKLYKRYGDSINFISNYDLKGIPYTKLENFNQLVDLGEEYEGDKQGTVVLIDEISSLLSHRKYSSFPLELIGLLCQQRKKRVYIMCTAQRFFMVDKIWRSLCTNVIDCNKLWRFQHGEKYDAWEYEQAINPRLVRRKGNEWWFVKDIDYHSYDTSQMVSKSSSSDFLSNEESLIRKGMENQTITNELGVKRPTRKLKKYLKRK